MILNQTRFALAGSSFALLFFTWVYFPGWLVGLASLGWFEMFRRKRPAFKEWDLYLIWGLACLLGAGGLVLIFEEPTYLHLLSSGATLELSSFFKFLLRGHTLSLGIALAGSLVAGCFGFLFGSILGMVRRGWGRVLDPLVQTFLAIPFLLFVLVGLVILPPGPGSLVLLFGFTLWIEPARMIQARFDELHQTAFVQTARMLGKSRVNLLWQEYLPNTLPVFWVSVMVIFLNAIVLEAILGYLGLGLSPGTPSLGKLLEIGSKIWPEKPMLLLGPLCFELVWLACLRRLIRRLDQSQQPLYSA